MATWRILSIDGGGIRGLIPAMVLAEIERRTGKAISEMFDLITGTSTGGILGLGLSCPNPDNGNKPYSASDMIQMYINDGPSIFSTSLLHQAGEWAGGGAKYPSTGIENALQKYFRDTRLSDALTNVMIPTYDVSLRSPRFFKSWNATDDGYYLMKQVARATSAAPTFFLPTKMAIPEGYSAYVDGGLIANNPTLCGLVEARRYAKPEDEYFIVSIGTGKYQRIYHLEEMQHWRPVEWLQPIIDICFDGASATVDYQLRQLQDDVGLKYFRFQTNLNPEFDSIDDASTENMYNLKTLGTRIFASEQINDFNAMVNQLMQLPTNSRPYQWAPLPVTKQTMLPINYSPVPSPSYVFNAVKRTLEQASGPKNGATPTNQNGNDAEKLPRCPLINTLR